MPPHSALRQAIEKGNLQEVRIALDNGADIEESDMHGDLGLPMRIACFKGHVDIVLELISRGANIHAANALGAGGPIRMASRGHHTTIVDLLLSHGARLPDDIQRPLTSAGERRGRGERRRRDIGPPGSFKERRQSHERRVLSVREVELSDMQWERYFAQTQPRQQPFSFHHDAADSVSMVLERVRD